MTEQLLRVQNFMLTRDGYGAGEGQSLERPFGHLDPGQLASWAGATASWPNRTDPGGSRGLDDYFTRDYARNIGAEIMGANKFSPHRGPWEDHEWQGWWGEDPPFHTPVFVLTHHPREPLTLSDTTFTFVTDGIESALEQASQAARGKDVIIGGGAATINQYLAGGLVDEIELHVVPILLGGGARLFADVDPGLRLEQRRALDAPGVAHLKYRVVK